MNLTELEQRWNTLTRHFSDDANKSAELFRKIVACYGETHRHYHTPAHLDAMFVDLDGIVDALNESDGAAVNFSTWYHDIVYRPGAKDNERQSALIAAADMRSLGVSAEIIAKVTYMVEATQSHKTDSEDLATPMLLDADMAILGKEPAIYSAYAENVRREFNNVPAFLFKRGRRKFLAELLGQARIFTTDHFYSRYEQSARNNIRGELEGG